VSASDVLRDGTPVEIVPMKDDDGERLVHFHDQLSPETTHLRFFSPHPELSVAEVERFTHVDHRDREALVAVSDGEIVAVARFDRLTDPEQAEVAFVVADSWQGRGLGTLLYDHLAERARRLGVRRFVAEALAHNRRMLAVFRRAGARSRIERGVVYVTIELEPSEKDFGPTESVPNAPCPGAPSGRH
jgi:RimJ/RimL family protein N-acetyltransferase